MSAPNNLKVLRKFREARNDPGEVVDRTCNCRVATECPLDNKCLLKNLIYQATVIREDGSAHSYIGQTTTTFKERWSNHKTSFKKAYKRNFSGLAKFIWDLKLQNKTWEISWRILKESQTYTRETRMCKLCQDEKFCILKMMKENPRLAINERSDLLKECGHKYKELLMDIGLYDKPLEAPVDPPELGDETPGWEAHQIPDREQSGRDDG